MRFSNPILIDLHCKFQRLVGNVLYKLGFKPCHSTGIHDGPTAGYGELDNNGFFEYPVPDEYWKKFFAQMHWRGWKEFYERTDPKDWPC